MLKIISFLLTIVGISFSQNYQLKGFVSDKNSSLHLSYANVRILNTFIGTATNQEGQFQLTLPSKEYRVVASYIGYKSDTIQIKLDKNKFITFNLEPTRIQLKEVVVNPNSNPAYSIIRKAINRRKKNKELIESYKYSSYSKGLIKTTKDFAEGGFSLSAQDTGKLKITGILENESRGFYKKLNQFKHFIVARKQTANTPPFINILTGGLLIQSFYENELNFFNKKIPSPISNNAIDYYYYYIEKELFEDNKKIYQINFSTDNPAAPGFYGKLFIEDSTFFLIKAEVSLNKMANPGGLFNYVKILQQFTVFDSIAMPIDYRIFSEGNYLGLAKFGFELHTIMHNYSVNSPINEDIFDSAILSVLPDADKKDNNYWKSIQSIPTTALEKKAYHRIDSLQEVSKTFGKDFSFLASKLRISDYFSISGPASFYSYDKVEGNTLNFDFYLNDAQEQRLNIKSSISYGFSDKLVKQNLEGYYLLGNYRTTKFSFGAFNNLKSLFESSNSYNRFTSTVLSLFTKYDFRHYYYSKGFYTDISSEIFPILQVGLGYFQNKDNSASNLSNFSFFYRDREYPKNKLVNNFNIRGIKGTFKVDFRKFIEDGFFRRRLTPENYIIFEGDLLYSNQNFLRSDLEFKTFSFRSYGSFVTAGNWKMDFSINRFISNSPLPLQYMYALPGNINGGSKNFSFRTLKIGEIFGDDVISIFLQHNFSDNLFSHLQIPFLKNIQIQFSTFLNIALLDVNYPGLINRDIAITKFKKPFYETGFSLGHPLIPIKLEFTWKLNYRNGNNFSFGLNTIAF